MKLQKRKKSAFILSAACGFISSTAARADSNCSDLLIRLVESSEKTGDESLQKQRTATILIPCEKLTGAPTLIHFMERQGERLCVTQRSCGNISAWRGSFGLSVGWSEPTLLRDFLLFANFNRNDWYGGGNQIVATFALNAGQIERDCSTLSPPTCLDAVK